jgi:hypothetical protein
MSATWYKNAVTDRKYRQQGYMDEGGAEKPRGGRPSGPRPRREGPRGRGLGAPTAEVFRCAVCGQQSAAPGAGETTAGCSSCGADLHSCTNCLHFDSSAPLECRKPVSKRIGGKAKSNMCELFEAKVTKEFGSDSGRPDDPKAAFDALFDL